MNDNEELIPQTRKLTFDTIPDNHEVVYTLDGGKTWETYNSEEPVTILNGHYTQGSIIARVKKLDGSYVIPKKSTWLNNSIDRIRTMFML